MPTRREQFRRQLQRLGRRFRSGTVPVSQFSLRPLRLALNSVEFGELTDLKPDADREVPYQVFGGFSATDHADLLDLLTINSSDIEPKDYKLEADVLKQNGQARTFQFTLSCAPLHNPRRVSGAPETERCVTITQVSAG
jgi:hypothetical protein